MVSNVRIGWYVGTAGASTASTRLRCLVPMAELVSRGRQVSIFTPGTYRPLEVVIFSKVYDDGAIATARSLRAQGIRVVLDLCDNHWFGEKDHKPVSDRVMRLEQMLQFVDLITASTPLLAEQIIERFNWPAMLIQVVPDPVLPFQQIEPSLLGRWELWQLKRFLNRHPGAAHLIWFGNHGANHVRSGMEDLERIRPIIDNGDTRFTLTVVSNSIKKYRKILSGWKLSSRYVPWRLSTIDCVLSMHHAAVIPITLNPFTAAKTINRPSTAIMAGLDVFADCIPSYEELSPFIVLNDWERLRNYSPASRNSFTSRRKNRATAYKGKRAYGGGNRFATSR